MHTEIDLGRFPRLAKLMDQATALAASDARVVELTDAVVDFVGSDEVAPVLTDALLQLVQDPGVNLAMMQQDNVVLANSYRGILLSIGLTQHDPDGPVFSAPSDTLLAPLTPAGMLYRTFELQSAFNPAVFDRSVSLGASHVARCEKGQAVLFEGGAANEYACSGSGVLKVFDQRPGPGLMWEFNRQTGAAIAAYAADAESTTLRYLVRFLTQFGDAQSAEAIQGLLTHPYHFVRWEAVKAIAAMTPDAVPAILHGLRDDPHPHVRNAARKMLEAA